jgi:hypothetical protein
LPPSVVAAVSVMIGLTPERHARRVRWAVGGVVTLTGAGLIYVNWSAYHTAYLAARFQSWAGVNGPIAEAWGVVDRDVPPAA